MLDHANLLRLLTYDATTGVFRWRAKPARRIMVGSEAGGANNFGGWFYHVIKIENVSYLAHRLAFFYMLGRWPVAEIDHRDGDGLNNSWSNLREATRAENAQNMGISKRNRTGFPGVTPFRRGWRSEICIRGIRKHLGVYDTPEAAAIAYKNAKRELHLYQPIHRTEIVYGKSVRPSTKEAPTQHAAAGSMVGRRGSGKQQPAAA